MFDELKESVCRANLALVKQGLVVMTWGNVSAVDRERGLVVIKPSGVAYDVMCPSDMVVTDLAGKQVDGDLKPSSDLRTHLALYAAWPSLGGVVHTHSPKATAFAQALTPIPCFGTTHADHFFGEVPVTRLMTREETENDYEGNTGRVIVERFTLGVHPDRMPAVLVANHGPFTWGSDAMHAVCNAVALEEVARMALDTWRLNPDAPALAGHLLEKHFLRKHGAGAYYGQG